MNFLAHFVEFLYLCAIINKEERKMRSYFKNELARAAGVSYRTFQRWLSQQSETLAKWGVTPRTQMLPPVAVKWICGQYGIDEGEL